MAAYKRTDEWGDTWHYRKRVTLSDGTSTRIAGTPAMNTKRAAEEAERAHVERLLNPPEVARARHKMSDVLDRFLTDYVVIAGNKGSEIATKKSAIDRYLKPELGHLYLDEIRAAQVAELAAKLPRMKKTRGEGTLGTKYVKNLLQTLRKCLRWAAKMEWIDKAPDVQMPRVDEEPPRFLEAAELVALLEVTAKEPLWFAAVLLAADAGLRRGELRALKWTDLNEVTNKIVITRSRWRNIDSSPKSRKPRSVPLTRRLAAALHATRGTKLRGPYVLSRADGGPFGAEFMQETIARLTRNAKVADCGWHTLRHTFCTMLAMDGAPAATIQKLAGHASLATTMRYMHVVQGATDDAIALLDKRHDRERARSGHGTSSDEDLDSEAGEILPFRVVTPLGLE